MMLKREWGEAKRTRLLSPECLRQKQQIDLTHNQCNEEIDIT